MNSSSPVPAPAASSKPQRFLRGLAWTGLVLGLVFVAGVGLAPVFFGGGYLTASISVAAVLAFSVTLWRLRFGAWQRLGFGYAGLAAVLIYLATDDAQVRRPQTLEEFAPAFPGAEKSYAVLMRYGKNHPLGREFHLKLSDKIYRGAGSWKPREHADWKAWLLSNRAELEKNWTELDPVHNWLVELNGFDRIGDLTPSDIDAEIIAFGPIRAISQHTCAVASLQAIDGKGDEAVETLLPVIAVGRKLTPYSRTLVRSMVAIVIQKLGMETADFILSAAEISPDSRARLAAALADEGGPEMAARKLIDVEYTWAASLYMKQNVGSVLAWGMTENMPPGWRRDGLQKILTPFSPFLYNSKRTINLYSDFSMELEDLAARRDVKQLDQRSQDFFRGSARMRFKNIGGTWIISAVVPAFSKVVEAYWKTEDLRASLYTRLKA